MPKRNLELLKKLKTRLMRMRHVQHYDIGTTGYKTDCGSAMCIAGHLLVLAGYKAKPIDETPRAGLAYWSPAGKRIAPGEATMREAARLSGVSRIMSETFCDFGLDTPKLAAARIQEYIEGKR